MSPMEISASQLNTFGDCARRWYYTKVLGLDEGPVGALTVFGSVIHYCLDVYETYSYDLDLALKTFRHYWRNPDQLNLKVDYFEQRVTWNALNQRGQDMLSRYAEMRPWRLGTLLGNEVYFEVPLGEHNLRGSIDRLYVHPGKKTVEVMDFKTGARVPNKLRYNLQFTAYLYATTRPELWEMLDIDPTLYQDHRREGYWYHARNGKMYKVGARTELDYKRLQLAADQMAAAHKAEVYPLTISGVSCEWCPFFEEVCGSEIE